MSFWDLGNNEKLGSETSFEDKGFEPIPDGSVVPAICTEAKWDEYQEDRYISLKWLITDGEYARRVIFQKLKVLSEQENARQRALRLFAVIDNLSGGKLRQKDDMPSSMDLKLNLENKGKILLKLKVWQIKDSYGDIEKEGNYIAGVSAYEQKPLTPDIPDNSIDDDLDF